VSEPTLTEALAARGYTHRVAGGLGGAYGRHDVMDASGRVVGSGSAAEIWEWLKQTAQEVLS